MTTTELTKLRATIDLMRDAGHRHVPVSIDQLERLIASHEARPALAKWTGDKKARAA